MMQLCLIMFLFAPAFASRGILTDPQGAEYAIDSPASWWRLEDVRGGCLSCPAATTQKGKACPPGGAWCSVTMEGLVEGRVDGIGPSEVSASRHAARFSGLGGLILPQGWDRPIQPAGYTIETFVKPGKPPFTGEQTVVMGGRVIVCDGVGREACMQSLMIENQGGKGGFEIILRPSGGTGDALELGARVTINGGAGKLTADLFAQEARAILPETWSHVALSVGAQYASLYLNATLVARSAVIGSMWDGKNMRVGMSEHGAWSGGWLRGVVDELAVYTREIEQLRLAVHHSVLLYETEAAPQGDCIRPPQTHTNLVQSCEAAKDGAKRLAGRGNVASTHAAEPPAQDENPDYGAANPILQGHVPW